MISIFNDSALAGYPFSLIDEQASEEDRKS